MSAHDPNDPKKPRSDVARKSSTREVLNEHATSGRVKFDDRGNAVWEWAVTTGAFANADDAATARMKKLDLPHLSIAEDAPTPYNQVKANPQGVVKGYNPYDSGQLDKKNKRAKKDLRRLSEWLKLRKQASANKADDQE